MGLDSLTRKKIEELQLIENHLKGILTQKQNIQIELNETANAIDELKNCGEEVYKVLSGFMVKSEKGKLSKELKEKNKFLEDKVTAIEKQEELIEKDAKKLRNEIQATVSRADKNKD